MSELYPGARVFMNPRFMAFLRHLDEYLEMYADAYAEAESDPIDDEKIDDEPPELIYSAPFDETANEEK